MLLDFSCPVSDDEARMKRFSARADRHLLAKQMPKMRDRVANETSGFALLPTDDV